MPPNAVYVGRSTACTAAAPARGSSRSSAASPPAATVPPTVRITGQNFGTAKGPVLFGWMFAAHQFGAAVAAYGSGVTRDSVLSYLPSFVAAGIACFVTVAFIATIRRPRPAAASA
jgi:hypothetical protein